VSVAPQEFSPSNASHFFMMLDAANPRLGLSTRNALKLGFFGANCSSGLAATKVPERWSGSWADNLALARLLDAAGIEFLLPIARWRGFGGATDFECRTLETLGWACGLLAATERIVVFGTVHAPLVHPAFAAKQMVTADHAGRGRFGLNVVCGWNADEFEMFGVTQLDHEARYAYGEEWLRVVRALWEREGSFDFSGTWFQLRGAFAEPKPFGGTRPVIMNAGSSTTGADFAARNADYLFVPIRWLEQARESVAATRARAHALGREVGVFTSASVVCRPTQREADEYFHTYAETEGDWDAVDRMIAIGMRGASTTMQPELFAKLRIRYAAGYGGWTVVGDPDRVAAAFAEIAAAGFSGVAIGMVNYLAEFPYFRDEVLPRLERLGLRSPQ
jgi:alkanesulfonate monooxygenase SsuD/methylene tetrahydromethanopterin reductase-like flavin-dependent oxidoreductase (luciferase family)